jgi:hypothetical protein
MAKSAISHRITVETKIGKIKFVQKPNGSFVVRTKGKERIRIRQARDGKIFEADAKEFNSVGAETIVVGKTPEQTFKRAVKHFWL